MTFWVQPSTKSGKLKNHSRNKNRELKKDSYWQMSCETIF